MIKKYLTYNQQMKYLREEKSIDCKGSAHKELLCRNGYFNLINGYKRPFIQRTTTEGKKYYFPNTSIEEIYEVKRFDEELRILLLGAITKAEEEARTFAAYKFDEVNDKGAISWYDTRAYSSNKKITDVVKVISLGYVEISKSKLDYVKHYLDQYQTIPTWVYFKVIRFSTFITTLTLCKEEVCNSLCELYNMIESNGKPDYKLLISALQFLRVVRNSCAHNERVFDIVRNNGRIYEPILLSMRQVYQRERKQNAVDCLIYLKYFLRYDDFEILVDKILDLLFNLQSRISNNAFQRIRASLGFKNLEDISFLKNNRNIKKYNSF